jgi:shikimate kinase
MTGVGQSHGAITVINAMPCGIGATIGASLETTARFSTGGNDRIVTIKNDPSENADMAKICVKRAYEVAQEEEPSGWYLETDSEIPVSRGLKSSSTACNAILRAVLAELDCEMDPINLIRLGVECAREAKVTITGSFDDACGSGLGGLVMTDNTRDMIISHSEIDDHDIIIHVPKYKIPKKHVPLEALHAVSPEIRMAIGLAMKKPFEAMTINGRVISRASDVDNSFAEKAISMGALGAGMSGSGPAITVVVPKGDGASFAKDMGCDPEETILTTTRCGE